MKYSSAIPYRENKRHGSQDYPCAFYQVNSSFLPPSTVFQAKHHWHEEPEIIYFRKGHFQLEINMQKYDIDKECFCFIGSGNLHHIFSEKNFEEQAFVFSLAGLSFSENDPVQAQIIRPLLNGELSLPAVIACDDACFNSIHQAFSNIYDAFSRSAPDGNYHDQYTLINTVQYLRIKACLYSIFSTLAESRLLSDASSISETDRRISTIKKALLYMKEHSGEKIYVRDIAAEVNMNEQYFCRFFKKIIDKSPIEYLTEIRIKNACKLLQNTDLSIMEVCLECGFNNLGNFMRAFRKYCDCTPHQYRKALHSIPVTDMQATDRFL